MQFLNSLQRPIVASLGAACLGLILACGGGRQCSPKPEMQNGNLPVCGFENEGLAHAGGGTTSTGPEIVRLGGEYGTRIQTRRQSQ